MRIWLITVGEPLPRFSSDARPWRTGLLADELAKRHHEVTWWTSTVDHFTKRLFVEETEPHDLSGNFRIQFLHGGLYRKNISLARLMNHRRVAAEFSRVSATYPTPDAIWCSLPTIELSEAASTFGVAHGVPAFIDIRDLWPDEIERRIPKPLRHLGRLALSPMSRSVERALRSATGLTAISQQYLDWGLRHARRVQGSTDRVFPMGYPVRSHATHAAGASARFLKMGVDPARRIFWFAGNFVSSADLASVIEAARILKDQTTVQFVLTGAGEMEAELRERARGLANVVFTGWVNQDELAWLANAACAGLVAYKRGALQSLPNKLLEYLSFGLPVLISLEGEARELVETENAGLAYAAEDPQCLARQVATLADRSELRATQSRNAKALAVNRFSADAIYRALAEFLEGVARRKSSDHARGAHVELRKTVREELR